MMVYVDGDVLEYLTKIAAVGPRAAFLASWCRSRRVDSTSRPVGVWQV